MTKTPPPRPTPSRNERMIDNAPGHGRHVVQGATIRRDAQRQATKEAGEIAGMNVLRVAPPLVITEAEVDEALRLLDRTCLRLTPSEAKAAAK